VIQAIPSTDPILATSAFGFRRELMTDGDKGHESEDLLDFVEICDHLTRDVPGRGLLASFRKCVDEAI
jgi:hypothetical protein